MKLCEIVGRGSFSSIVRQQRNYFERNSLCVSSSPRLFENGSLITIDDPLASVHKHNTCLYIFQFFFFISSYFNGSLIGPDDP